MKRKNIIIIAIVVLLLGAFLYVDYGKNNTTKTLFATAKEKGEPANLSFVDDDFYKLVIDSYNFEHVGSPKKQYTDVLTDEELADISEISQGVNSSYSISDTTGIEKLTGLTKLVLNGNLFQSIDLSHCTSLERLSLRNGNLRSVDVSENTALTVLNLSGNSLGSIDLSNNTVLEELYLDHNIFSNINLSNVPSLKKLYLSDNQLKTININGNTALITLSLDNNKLTNVDLSNNTALKTLSIRNNTLASINLSNNEDLETVDLYSNELTTLDVSNNTSIVELGARENRITSIDLGENNNLTTLDLCGNGFQTIDLSEVPSLTTLDLSFNFFTSLDLSKNTALITLDVSGSSGAVRQLTSLDLSSNTSLTSLTAKYNKITSIDLSKNVELQKVDFTESKLSEIDLSHNVNLTSIILEKNNLEEIDVTKNTNLKRLDLDNNNIESIDLSKNTDLLYLFMYNNNLEEIDLSNNNSLQTIGLSGNPMLELNIAKGKSITNPVTPPSSYEMEFNISNETIADYSGNKITGLEVGTTNFEIVLTTGGSSPSTIKLNGKINVVIPVSAVVIDQSTANVSVGNTVQLNATVYPENATNKEVVWESEDTSVATVSSTGLVTGVGEGTTSIIVRTVDGDYTSMCDVTVIVEKININYYANNGTDNVITREVVKNETTTIESNSFTKTGYAFKEWNTKANGSGTSYKVGASIKPTADVNLYAVYTRVIDNIFTVTGIANKTYTGNNLTQKFAVYDGSTIVRYKTDFLVTYSNNKNIGIAKVIISGIGNYSGSISKNFKILPKSPTLKKVTSPKKGYAQMVYTSVAGGVYYQVAYKQKGASKWTQINTKLTTKTMKGFNSGKYYYFTVRSYKKVNGVVYYSPWSNKIKIKIK